MEEVRALHKEWFPVDYSERYFENIKNGKYKMILAYYDYKIAKDK